MYHLDANINLAVERSVEKMQAVRTFDLPSASQLSAADGPSRSGSRLAARLGGASALVTLLIALVLALQAWA